MGYKIVSSPSNNSSSSKVKQRVPVTSRANVMPVGGLSNGTDTSGTAQFRVPITADCYNLVLAFPNFQGNLASRREAPAPNAVTFKAAINMPTMVATLSAAISSTSATTFTVNTPTNLIVPATPFNVIIDSEVMTVTSVNLGNNTFTVTRGAEGTTAATHSNGATVEEKNFVPVTFKNGTQSITVDAGATAYSEPVGISLKRGDVIKLRVYTSVASAGQKWPTSLYTNNLRGEGYVANTDALTTGMIATSATWSYCPIILGYTVANVPVVGIIGDSISTGGTDSSTSASRNWNDGWWVRVFEQYNKPICFIKLANGGETAAQFVQGMRGQFMNLCTHLVCAHGTNDLIYTSTTMTQTQYQNRLNSIHKQAAETGAKVYGVTVTPNQGLAAQMVTLRQQGNDYLRSLPSPLTGVIDIGGYCETSTNSNTWRTDLGTLCDDGVHPNSNCHNQVATNKLLPLIDGLFTV